jgi:nitroreductase
MNEINDLYQAILARQSTRRFARETLDGATLSRVRQIVAQVRPLVSETRFEVQFHDVAEGQNLVEALGGYGRIVSPPHYLLPYGTGDTHLLADLGYRVEQIAVRLTAMGVGSCYVGALGREDAVRAEFDLPAEARIGAFLVYGYPTERLGGRALNALLRRAVGAATKQAADQLFFEGSFAAPSAPPEEVAPLIEAARSAPSAVNAQPWRFLWRDGALYVFVRRHNPRYGPGHGEYRLYDDGICLGNVQLALEALDRPGHWTLLNDETPDLPEHPAELEPLARLSLAEQMCQEGS